jgi:hypothetical protein
MNIYYYIMDILSTSKLTNTLHRALLNNVHSAAVLLAFGDVPYIARILVLVMSVYIKGIYLQSSCGDQ